MRKIHLLTADEAGKLMQFGVLTTKAPKMSLGDFIAASPTTQYCLVETDVMYLGAEYTMKLAEVLAISAPIACRNDIITYGAVYMTNECKLLKGRFRIGDLSRK